MTASEVPTNKHCVGHVKPSTFPQHLHLHLHDITACTGVQSHVFSSCTKTVTSPLALGQAAQQSIWYTIIVPHKLVPFSFPFHFIMYKGREEEREQTTCMCFLHTCLLEICQWRANKEYLVHITQSKLWLGFRQITLFGRIIHAYLTVL